MAAAENSLIPGGRGALIGGVRLDFIVTGMTRSPASATISTSISPSAAGLQDCLPARYLGKGRAPRLPRRAMPTHHRHAGWRTR
jgi:hypothetical protein